MARFRTVTHTVNGQVITEQIPFTPKEEAERDAEEAAFANAPTPVPQVVSRLQARLALQKAGLLESVETAIAALSKETQMIWQDAVQFSRTSPTLLAVATQLNIDETQLDSLFRDAAEIKV